MVIKGTQRVLTRRIEMRKIRYVARLRLSIPTLILGGLLYVGAGIAIARLLIFVAMRLLTSGVSPVESYVLQTGAYVLIGAIALVLVMVYASLPPRKLLVFTDRLLVKSAVCRSRDIPLDQIVSVGLRRITDVARRGQLGSTLPLSLGVGSPAVHIDVRGGHGYLVRVRDAGELLGVLAELGVTVERPERSAGAAIAPA